MKKTTNRLQTAANQFFCVQLSVVGGVAGIIAIVGSAKFGLSLFMGGLIVVIAHWFFANKLFSKLGRASNSHAVLRDCYFGEMRKMLVATLLFALTIKFIPIHFVGLISGVIMAQLSFRLAPIFFTPKRLEQA